MPVRNEAASLDATLASVCSQAIDAPIEVIVVDDHSTDETGAIVRELMQHAGGNISEAARRLGMHRRSLQRKLARGRPSHEGAPTPSA